MIIIFTARISPSKRSLRAENNDYYLPILFFPRSLSISNNIRVMPPSPFFSPRFQPLLQQRIRVMKPKLHRTHHKETDHHNNTVITDSYHVGKQMPLSLPYPEHESGGVTSIPSTHTHTHMCMCMHGRVFVCAFVCA